jgi:CheY-like chemotaxis protein
LALSQIGTTYAPLHFVARNKKILVVEDNNEWRELLVKILNHFGYDVIESGSGGDAIDKTLEMHPDLILMDIYLPDIIGLLKAPLQLLPARSVQVSLIRVLQFKIIRAASMSVLPMI